MNKGRLEAFTDAIVAIAATIMVLQLTIPTTPDLQGLSENAAKFVAYLVSFLMIYVGWFAHHNLFKKAEHITTRTFIINGFWIFLCSLVPFTAAWVGHAADAVVPEVLYHANLLFWRISFQLLDRQILPYIKKLVGSVEFINNKKRWCLWLVGVSPTELRKLPQVMKRIQLCKEDRGSAPDEGRRKLAEKPFLFRETKNPDSYIIVPATSSERRRYIPLGFLGNDTIPTNAVIIIPNANLYHFGVLTSNVHMAWMRTVCGRLKSDYRYSKDIVYNNFPWPDATPAQQDRISQTAQAILDARALYPDASLADLYDELTMPPELRKAHQQNDRAVMEAYGMPVRETTESSCVAELMRRYQALTAEAPKKQ